MLCYHIPKNDAVGPQDWIAIHDAMCSSPEGLGFLDATL